MKYFFLMGVAFSALISPALGADLIEPAYQAPAVAWTGLYGGVNAGYTFGADDSVTASTDNSYAPGSNTLAQAIRALANSTSPIKHDGFIGGGQVGYNFYQIPWLATSLVAGVEADIQGASGKGSFNSTTFTPVTGTANQLNQTAAINSSINYLGTVRGRLGFLVGLGQTSVLYYATAGVAYGGLSGTTTITQSVSGPNVLALTPPIWTGSGQISGTRFGLAAGVGAEWLFSPNWSTGFQWIHYDLGNSFSGPILLVSNAGVIKPFTSTTLTETTPFSGEIFRAAVNYHF
jgi:outer membrane immunogenic protein